MRQIDLFRSLSVLFIVPSTSSWWHTLLIWIIRISTISLLLRTYIVPWVLARLSNHIRIRSVSLRSLRGLYIRRGSHTWRIERIAYRWSYTEGLNRLAIKVEGLSVELGGKDQTSPPRRRHKRKLTLADFGPSPMARRLWKLASDIYSVFDPFFRPAVRALVASGLGHVIRWLPKITQRLTFDLNSAVITFQDMPGTRIVTDNIHFQVTLSFSQLGNTGDDLHQSTSQRRPTDMYSMTAWQSFFAESLRRSWDRAWGRAEGTAAITLQITEVAGYTSSSSPSSSSVDAKTRRFFGFPGLVDVHASLHFNPRHASINAHSLLTSLNMGEVYLALDACKDVWDLYKRVSLKGCKLQDGGDSDPTSPLSDSVMTASPLSPTSTSLFSPISPNSPFFEAISTTMRNRRRVRHKVSKLSDSNGPSLLSILLSGTLRISTVRLVAHPGDNPRGAQHTYEALIHDVNFEAELSDSTRQPLYSRWLGISRPTDVLHADCYSFQISMQRMTIDRYAHGSHIQLMSSASFRLLILISQWPAPLLHHSNFMIGDPNAAFLGIQLELGPIHLTERIEFIHEALASSHSTKFNLPKSPLSPLEKKKLHLPRIMVEIHCGPICGRIICGLSRLNDIPRAMEFQTDGLTASASSSFASHRALRTKTTGSAPLYCLPVQMDLKCSAILSSTLFRVRSLDKSGLSFEGDFGVFDPTFLDDPALLSLDTFEIVGEVKARGELNDECESIPTIDQDAIVIDAHVFSDTLAIELWHPAVIAVISQCISIPSHNYRSSTPQSSAPRTNLVDRLPSGISASLAISRIVIFITAPELNRRDGLDLSRGCVLRTGIRVQYCFLESGHAVYFEDILQTTQTRQKLYLPEMHYREAISNARASQFAQTSSASVNVTLVRLSVRSAVTTPYASDDPLITERDDPTLSVHEFLHIKRADLGFKIVGRRRSPEIIPATCEVWLRIPDVRATFQMAYIYSVLLASRTLLAFADGSYHPASLSNDPSNRSGQPRVLIQAKVELNTMQILWNLPKQKVLTRLDSLVAQLSSTGSVASRFSRLRICALLPPDSDGQNSRWGDFATFQSWNISLPSLKESPLSLSLQGDSGHVRIPSNIIFSDLILDIVITLKAVRHLIHIVPSGRFVKMPAPDAEPAKSVPNVKIRLRTLCLEASDDSFESKLAVICKAGLDASKFRQERERAFMLKVAAILGGDLTEPASAVDVEVGNEFKFDAKHTVSIENARQRLDQLHAFDWTFRHRTIKEMRAAREETFRRHIRGTSSYSERFSSPDLVEVEPTPLDPPLCRILLNGLSLDISPPSFALESLPDFLYKYGAGLPRETQFYLLVPLHLLLRLTALRIWLRDYPLPLVDISNHEAEIEPAFTFQGQLVIAEETGIESSIEWFDCPVIERNQGIEGAAPLSISVPKTIMPVKTYANPDIYVSTANVTSLSWAVSYGPAIQDLTRIIDTLSSPPRDSSPILGFWDKLRLVFHWKIKATFKGDVHLYMKGLRDPYELSGEGAGFVLSWRGHPKLLIGYENASNEIAQVISDSMVIAIPSQEILRRLSLLGPNLEVGVPSPGFQKVCAKFASGVRFGIGCMLERACGPECLVCSGAPFDRRCRIFDFRPHYAVKLTRKDYPPERKGPQDSYNEFRSDFIHLSLSLASSIHPLVHQNNGRHHLPSSLHLTPKVFAHFWSWLALFDSVLSLPIRQGTLYPRRHISPKFGRHLATLKYRISVPRLFVLHAYMDESRETWVDGVTPFVGIKAMVDDVQIDMHQRDQETIVPGRSPSTTRVIRRKAFYAAEVVLKGLGLRAMLATFDEPLKQAVPVTCPPQRSNYRTRQLPTVDPTSDWLDNDDFVEVDWTPSTTPTVHLLPILSCPRFYYCKRQPLPQANQVQRSKFGEEASHTCMLGKEPSSTQIQRAIASERITELQNRSCMLQGNSDNPITAHERATTQRMVNLLEEYVEHLQENRSSTEDEAYLFPSGGATPEEWAMFDNVYQIHCPKIYLSSAIRDIMLQYYYCSRARRGYEYHLATRAVRYILDQAEAIHARQAFDKPKSPFQHGQAAASALRKILTGDSPKTSVEISDLPSSDDVDPMYGWSDVVSLLKSHFFLLLKPQIILKSEARPDSVLVLAAVQAKLQLFHIMDKSNVDDPVSGKVMSRNYGSLTGLQTFSPVASLHYGDGSVPLEVLVDFRCESDEFDRIVPQTNATFQYDKFNRLRLRNNVTSIARTGGKDPSLGADDHLHNQTDLIQVKVPRFTVTASDEHFQTISDIITNVLLFSDATQKTRLDKLETLLFTYDFTDLMSAAGVVSDVQSRLRNAVEVERLALAKTEPSDNIVELLKLKAHICLLAEELTYLFDAIKMAQDRVDDQNDQKSALLLHASSDEISWRMLDENKGLLAKLALRHINFRWLSRRDSSTVNNLDLADLQAFDGARNALWTEILCKYDEPANHPLLKRGLFLLAHWTVLAPVGGITIYEDFELTLHPIRLQIDANLGRRIMEYLWPARKARHKNSTSTESDDGEDEAPKIVATRASLDSPRALQGFPSETNAPGLRPPQVLRRLGPSRSFTDLRSSTVGATASQLARTRSTDALKAATVEPPKSRRDTVKVMDAAEMKTRSSQKSFVLVKISSLHILLSIKKDDVFECREARIRTRDLEYRNQTWSFEELVDQFIPSDMSWRGWVKMALHQPLVPVLPVARELISKTKWITASKSSQSSQSSTPIPPSRPASRNRKRSQSKKRSPSPGHGRWRKMARKRPDTPPTNYHLTAYTAEPDDMEAPVPPMPPVDRVSRPENRPKVFGLFSRKSSRSRKSTDNNNSSSTVGIPDNV